MTQQVKIALIYGSTREGRFCDTIVSWACEEIAKRTEFALDLIDPATLALPSRHERKAGAAVTALRQRLDLADAFIIVTPEYNHGYPAALKFLIDSVHDQWQAKPAAFISYGGISGGLRAVEQLRLVFAELHAVTIRDTVSFTDYWDQFDTAGKLLAPERVSKPMAVLLARLHWWATALRDARTVTPYEEVVA